jgi:hypothetical protein
LLTYLTKRNFHMTIASDYLTTINKSFKDMKLQAEKAMAQVTNEQLHYQPDSESNSIVIIVKHIRGNMLSRWTDFFTSDGEKLNRHRDDEFIDDIKTKEQLLQIWEEGWVVLFNVILNLKEEDLEREITIRGEKHTVLNAIIRQLAHYSHHIGQIVYLSKHLAGANWNTLSIPRGKSEEYLHLPPKK